MPVVVDSSETVKWIWNGSDWMAWGSVQRKTVRSAS